MRQRNIVKTFLLSILVSGLLVNCGVRNANGQDSSGDTEGVQSEVDNGTPGEEVTIEKLLTSANQLETAMYKVHGNLKFLVRKMLTKDDDLLTELSDEYQLFIKQWNDFAIKLCGDNKDNCQKPEIQTSVTKIDENVTYLKNIEPIFNSNNIPDSKKIDTQEVNKEINKIQKEYIFKDQPRILEIEAGKFLPQTHDALEIKSTEAINSVEIELIKLSELLKQDIKKNGEPENNIDNILAQLNNNIFSLLNLVILTILGLLLVWNNRKSKKMLTDLAKSNSEIKRSVVKKDTESEEDVESKDNLDEIPKIITNLTKIDKDLREIKGSLSEVNNSFSAHKVQETLSNKQEFAISEITLSNISDLIIKPLITQKLNVNKEIAEKKIPKDIEDLSNARESVNDDTTSPPSSKKTTETAPITSIISTLIDSEELKKIITNYNENAQVLIKDIVKVAALKEDIAERRTGRAIPLIFKEDNNESYWVVRQPKLPNNYYFLVPKPTLVINPSIHQTAEDIFICDGYQNRAPSNKFKLLLPAVVKSRGDNEWELAEPGELFFEEKI